MDPQGIPSPSSSATTSVVSAADGVAPPKGTLCSDSLHLTQNSHLALFRAPQFGQTRESGSLVAFMVSFRLHPPTVWLQGDFQRQTLLLGRILPANTSPLEPSLVAVGADGGGGAGGAWTPPANVLTSPLSTTI